MTPAKELFLSNEPLPSSPATVPLDIFSQESVLVRGPELAAKKILEGKITMNPTSNLICSIPPMPRTSLLAPDSTKWDMYLISIPFTLHKAPGRNRYESVTIFIELSNQAATAFDLFPHNIITYDGTTTYVLSSEAKIEKATTDQAHTNGSIRFADLRPIIKATGLGDNKFYWVFQSSKDQQEVIPETKHVLIVLRVPRGTTYVDGTVSYEVQIAKNMPGKWLSTRAEANPYQIHWELGAAASPLFTQDRPSHTQIQSSSMPSKSKPSFDVCIVGALAEEAKAFIKVTEDQGFPKFQSALNARRQEYYYTTVKNNKGEPLDIHVSWQTSYGPEEAILHLQRTLEEFNPRFIGMTGICAGDKRKVRLGDIIVAERTFLSDTGKFVLDKDEHRRREYDAMTRFPPENVLHFVRGFEGWKPAVEKLSRPISKHQQRDWLLKTLLDEATPSIDKIGITKLNQYAPDWRKIVHALQEGSDAYLTKDRMLRDPSKVYDLFYGMEIFPFEDPSMPEVYIAPMASGNAVRADDPFDDIRVPVHGTIAIDMEGASFYRATTDFPGIHALLVKAVSDYADIDKDDSYHTYASEVSAAYMLSLIREYVTVSRIPVTD